ncbi:uncharacterized protein UV8b_03488 [Ustilaginoidea virens]|uniref:Uncharacterized protein n=1 Tax=Ustilaginoidea virens TaxID=1159556 RepID=A0A8E5MGT2_USTVR|nr:uncharacterized protein UV8b_03488 [Ustilaginoidea virens]QUC19247.1 hypothetical protein UV8b_03488 [Ustilaginoidea virens]
MTNVCSLANITERLVPASRGPACTIKDDLPHGSRDYVYTGHVSSAPPEILPMIKLRHGIARFFTIAHQTPTSISRTLTVAQ